MCKTPLEGCAFDGRTRVLATGHPAWPAGETLSDRFTHATGQLVRQAITENDSWVWRLVSPAFDLQLPAAFNVF